MLLTEKGNIEGYALYPLLEDDWNGNMPVSLLSKNYSYFYISILLKLEINKYERTWAKFKMFPCLWHVIKYQLNI